MRQRECITAALGLACLAVFVACAGPDPGPPAGAALPAVEVSPGLTAAGVTFGPWAAEDAWRGDGSQRMRATVTAGGRPLRRFGGDGVRLAADYYDARGVKLPAGMVFYPDLAPGQAGRVELMPPAGTARVVVRPDD